MDYLVAKLLDEPDPRTMISLMTVCIIGLVFLSMLYILLAFMILAFMTVNDDVFIRAKRRVLDALKKKKAKETQNGNEPKETTDEEPQTKENEDGQAESNRINMSSSRPFANRLIGMMVTTTRMYYYIVMFMMLNIVYHSTFLFIESIITAWDALHKTMDAAPMDEAENVVITEKGAFQPIE